MPKSAAPYELARPSVALLVPDVLLMGLKHEKSASKILELGSCRLRARFDSIYCMLDASISILPNSGLPRKMNRVTAMTSSKIVFRIGGFAASCGTNTIRFDQYWIMTRHVLY